VGVRGAGPKRLEMADCDRQSAKNPRFSSSSVAGGGDTAALRQSPDGSKLNGAERAHADGTLNAHFPAARGGNHVRASAACRFRARGRSLFCSDARPYAPPVPKCKLLTAETRSRARDHSAICVNAPPLRAFALREDASTMSERRCCASWLVLTLGGKRAKPCGNT